MFAPGVPALMEEFRITNPALGSWVVSIYILGFAAGPMVLAPLSEMYGRAIIYNTCNVGFFVLTIGCAIATDMGMLIAFRFLEGVFGSAVLTLAGGTIADMV